VSRTVQTGPRTWGIEYAPEELERIRKYRLRLRLKMARERMHQAIDRYLELKLEAQRDREASERGERVN
jgi:hypothetical protein